MERKLKKKKFWKFLLNSFYYFIFWCSSSFLLRRGGRGPGSQSHPEHWQHAQDPLQELPVHRGLAQGRHVQQRQRPVPHQVRWRDVHCVPYRPEPEHWPGQEVERLMTGPALPARPVGTAAEHWPRPPSGNLVPYINVKYISITYFSRPFKQLQIQNVYLTKKTVVDDGLL